MTIFAGFSSISPVFSKPNNSDFLLNLSKFLVPGEEVWLGQLRKSGGEAIRVGHFFIGFVKPGLLGQFFVYIHDHTYYVLMKTPCIIHLHIIKSKYYFKNQDIVNNRNDFFFQIEVKSFCLFVYNIVSYRIKKTNFLSHLINTLVFLLL